MNDTVTNEEQALPKAEAVGLPNDGEATRPTDATEDFCLEIKFNKELIKLDRETAAALAQKGMKYEKISEEYSRLKSLAEAATDDIDSLKEEFPEISSADMLPDQVKTAAKLSNRGLLFEYLLYEHRQHKAAVSEALNQSYTAAATTGSLSADDRQDPTAAEFLRGVWGK